MKARSAVKPPRVDAPRNEGFSLSASAAASFGRTLERLIRLAAICVLAFMVVGTFICLALRGDIGALELVGGTGGFAGFTGLLLKLVSGK